MKYRYYNDSMKNYLVISCSENKTVSEIQQELTDPVPGADGEKQKNGWQSDTWKDPQDEKSAIKAPGAGNGTDAEIGYQYQMISANHIAGLLPCSIRRINNELLLYIDITSLQSMDNLFRKRRINGVMLKKILYSLADTGEAISRFLLDCRRIQLNPQFIFYSDAKDAWYFVYYPRETDADYRTFFQYMETRHDPQDKMAAAMIYRLCDMADNQNFVLSSHLLDQLYQTNAWTDAPLSDAPLSAACGEEIPGSLQEERFEGYSSGRNTDHDTYRQISGHGEEYSRTVDDARTGGSWDDTRRAERPGSAPGRNNWYCDAKNRQNFPETQYQDIGSDKSYIRDMEGGGMPQSQAAWGPTSAPQSQSAWGRESAPQGQSAWRQESVSQSQPIWGRESASQGQPAWGRESSLQSHPAWRRESTPQGQSVWRPESVPQSESTWRREGASQGQRAWGIGSATQRQAGQERAGQVPNHVEQVREDAMQDQVPSNQNDETQNQLSRVLVLAFICLAMAIGAEFLHVRFHLKETFDVIARAVAAAGLAGCVLLAAYGVYLSWRKKKGSADMQEENPPMQKTMDFRTSQLSGGIMTGSGTAETGMWHGTNYR